MQHRIKIDEAKSVLVLTAALVLITTWGVAATGWTRGMNMLTFVAVGSLLIGLMLARSGLPGVVAHLFSAVIGVGWAFWVTSRLLPATYTWLERWDNLAGRLYNWYLTAIQGGVSYDNLMFILQMGVIIWGVGYLTVWFIFRSQKPWPAIVPGGLVLLINLYYAPRDISTWFVLYLIVALVLIVRFNLYEQELHWRSRGVFFRPDINFDFLRDGLIFSLLVVGLAWFLPPVVDAKSIEVLDEFQGSWRDLQGDWNRLFADLNYRDRAVYDSFGSSLTLGGARQLSDEMVMDVQVSGVGRYWRAAVYDYYSGDGWIARDEDRANFGPDSDLSLPVFDMREPITQTYTFHRDNATVIYAMSNPIKLDRSARINFTALPGELVTQEAAIPGWTGGSEPWVEEITYIRTNATVDKGESYSVVSLASRATIDQLQSAGSNYPSWVTSRYLNLPPSVTQRTLDLARQITAAYDNNFDKAEAIERYLRNNITYNEAIPAPPPGIDKVDYILFTRPEAYCDYYATAMIVMLRSQGIPARLAAGFARGVYNDDKAAFEVRNRDAHSWVEVYFPTYGWLEFEPTATQPTIIRPTANERGNSFAAGAFVPTPAPDLGDGLDTGPQNIPIDDETVAGGNLPFGLNLPFLGGTTALGGGVLLLGVAVLLVGGAVWWWRQQQPDQLPKAENTFTLYRQMVRLAGWMRLPLRPSQTPFEHAAVLQRNLPRQQDSVQVIAEEYVQYAYSRQHSASPDSQTAAQAWHHLRPEMLKQSVIRRLPGWLRRRFN